MVSTPVWTSEVNLSRLICRWDELGNVLEQERLHLALAEVQRRLPTYGQVFT